MQHVDDPAYMTQEERATEVAAILAKGILRLQNRNAAPDGHELAGNGDDKPSGNSQELP